MGYRIDLVGKRFGRILVISFKGNGKNYNTLWNCKCDCGKEFVCTGGSLRSGNATSFTPEEAYKARIEAEKKYYGEFAYKEEASE